MQCRHEGRQKKDREHKHMLTIGYATRNLVQASMCDTGQVSLRPFELCSCLHDKINGGFAVGTFVPSLSGLLQTVPGRRRKVTMRGQELVFCYNGTIGQCAIGRSSRRRALTLPYGRRRRAMATAGQSVSIRQAVSCPPYR